MPTLPPNQFQFCGPSYLAASPVIDAQRSINLYPEPGYKSSKTGMALIGRPGLTLFGTNANSPARSLWAGHARLFSVGGTHVYERTTAGAQLTDFGAMAGSTGIGSCQWAHDGVRLAICDPLALNGGVPGRIYYVNPVGPACTPVFNGVALEYLDGFFVAIATGASLSGTNPNQINVSANLDPTTWSALNFVLRTGAADLTTQLAVLNGLLWIFGEKTIEVWYNAGNPGFPFARVQGATINLGLLASNSVVKFYNTIMWLGADDRGYAQVYMSQGTNPVRVSNFAIENFLAQQWTGANVSAYGYQEAGHTFYVLNINNAGSPPLPATTLVYDLTTGLWHERSYGYIYPMCFASVPGFNSVGGSNNYIGDAATGGIYQQSILTFNDDLTGATRNNITYTRVSPHVCDSNKWLTHNRFELDGDFGTASPLLDYSDNGQAPGSGRQRVMRQAADSGRGTVSPTFRRFFANQLGRSRDRIYAVTIVDNSNLIRIANAYLEVAE